MITYSYSKATDLSDKEAGECLSLCFRSNGEMAENLRLCRRHYIDAEGHVFTARRDDGRLEGWALGWRFISEFEDDPEDPIEFNIYVRKGARRTGVGKSLVALAKQSLPDVEWETFPWDDRSESFFKSVGLPD